MLLDWFSETSSRNSDKWPNERKSGSQNTIAWNKLKSSTSLESFGEALFVNATRSNEADSTRLLWSERVFWFHKARKKCIENKNENMQQ